MSGSNAYMIAGAGLVGAKAAETLRGEGFDGPGVLIGDEAERPYERPPLSKDYLLGKAERETIYVHPESWYADNGVQLRLGVPVAGIDRAAHEVALADGTRIGYARLLLATGSSPLLAGRRPGAGRHERQHLGRQRRDPGPGQRRPPGGPRPGWRTPACHWTRWPAEAQLPVTGPGACRPARA